MKKLLLLLLFVPGALYAQSSGPVKLNELNLTKQKTASGNHDIVYTSINEEFFNNAQLRKGTRFLFESRPGVSEEFILTRVTRYSGNAVSIQARKAREINSEFALTYSDGKIVGQYASAPGEIVYLGYEKAAASNFITPQIPVRVINAAEGKDYLIPENQKNPKNDTRQKAHLDARVIRPNVAAMAQSIEDSVTIDVMLVYTEAAESWATDSISSSSIQSIISQAMNLAQQAHDNSKTGIHLRLVHTMKVNYDETIDGIDSDERLVKLTEGKGPFAAVHNAREEFGADLVAMLARVNDTGGIGWILNDPIGNPDAGFSVNRVQQIAYSYTMVHEMGHNMGSHHSRTQTSSASNDYGGVFQYSAGFQDVNNNFYTIMAYSDGLSVAPIFSSPDLMHNNFPAGETDALHPTDNARSLKEIKRVVAGYRPSKVESPILSPITGSIMVEMNREDEKTIPITLNNTGNSQLMWLADLDIPDFSINKVKSASLVKSKVQPVQIKSAATPYNLPIQQKTQAFESKYKINPATLYETSFEESDNYETGNFIGVNEWRGIIDDNVVQISSQNPKTGSNHLRVSAAIGEEKYTIVSSPFFGAQPFGAYEVQFDLNLSNNDALNDTLDIYFYDGNSGELSAGIIIDVGVPYYWGHVADFDNTGFYSLVGDIGLKQSGYNQFRIRLDNVSETLTYYKNGIKLADFEYTEGKSFDLIYVLNRSGTISSTLDIDNVKITRLWEGYPWLNLGKYAGSVSEGQSQNLNLEFNTRGISAGEYETTLVVQTNDPNRPVQRIPVYLTVNTTIDNEIISETPKATSLNQNYPNPFNPVTNISYTINQPSEVRLEVFNIQGQKVADLVKEKMEAGTHQVAFNASNLASGIYLYRLKAGNQTFTKRMVLVK